MLANNFVRGYPTNFITIDDDDDDVQIYSPGPSRETIRFFPRSSSWVPVLTEEDLELRLGLGAHFRHSGNSARGAKVPEDGCHDQQAWKYGKDCGQVSSSYWTPDVREVKLRCAICMDTMKEETSTVCGHIFCKPCITDAVLFQKKCPACRAKLSIQNIHRIYLPGATS
uniref:Putative E3 ubiquitin-protein ligase bre1 n=1 Tax=Anthurium amnicola TaxID=1678845 RepID=A0A1D1Y5D4_9ARAE